MRELILPFLLIGVLGVEPTSLIGGDAHTVILVIETDAVHEFGETTQRTRLAVRADVLVEMTPGGQVALQLAHVSVEPTTTSTMTFAASQHADSGVRFLATLTADDRLGQVSVPEGAGPVARYLLAGIPFLVGRPVSVLQPVVDTFTTATEDQFGMVQLFDTAIWAVTDSAKRDSISVTVTGHGEFVSLSGGGDSRSRKKGGGWIVQSGRFVTSGHLEWSDVTEGESNGTPYTSTRTVRVTIHPPEG